MYLGLQSLPTLLYDFDSFSQFQEENRNISCMVVWDMM